ncbi:MAG TPA: MgtC/SapB family protein [Microvirga sp.]|nr:MgtC/SapB family protein [Microvirga sp.]
MTDWLYALHAEHREEFEMLLRLCFATVSGMAIGLNRDLHGKPIGMRTLGLVSLASALVVMAGSAYGHVHFEEDAVSRVVQGILTGIGFLGAGVIIRRQDGSDVQGLTTASTVWIAAALGVTAGVGAWFITIVGNGLALALLVFGKPVEWWFSNLFGSRKETGEGSDG